MSRVFLFLALVPPLFACGDGDDGGSGDGSSDPAAICEPGGVAFVSTGFSGGYEQQVDWIAGGSGDQQLACGSFGTTDGLALTFGGQDADGKQISLLLDMTGLQAGQTGEVSGALTVGTEQQDGLFSSAADGCTYVISSHTLLSSDSAGETYRIEGDGTCADGLTDLFGENPVTVGPISFTAVSAYLAM